MWGPGADGPASDICAHGLTISHEDPWFSRLQDRGDASGCQSPVGCREVGGWGEETTTSHPAGLLSLSGGTTYSKDLVFQVFLLWLEAVTVCNPAGTRARNPVSLRRHLGRQPRHWLCRVTLGPVLPLSERPGRNWGSEVDPTVTA